jgi:hypothetical protein
MEPGDGRIEPGVKDMAIINYSNKQLRPLNAGHSERLIVSISRICENW